MMSPERILRIAPTATHIPPQPLVASKLSHSARHHHTASCSRFVRTACFGHSQGPDGNSVLHALVLAGEAQAARGVVLALPSAEALALLRRRNHASALATELTVWPDAPPEHGAAVGRAALELATLAQQLAPQQRPPPTQEAPQPASSAAAASVSTGSMGRGGAVRRRKSGSEGGADPSKGASKGPSRGAVCNSAPSSSDEGKAAAAAGDLLQLAAAAAGVAPPNPGRARANQPVSRQRDAKPYQRRGAARGGGRGGKGDDAQKECWLPGGFWWQDNRTPMPTGRQPGELAGWSPLAGDLTQQRMQEEHRVLSVKEHFVQVCRPALQPARLLARCLRASACFASSSC